MATLRTMSRRRLIPLLVSLLALLAPRLANAAELVLTLTDAKAKPVADAVRFRLLLLG